MHIRLARAEAHFERGRRLHTCLARLALEHLPLGLVVYCGLQRSVPPSSASCSSRIAAALPTATPVKPAGSSVYAFHWDPAGLKLGSPCRKTP